MPFTSWSTNPANNAVQGAIDWSEGMLPSQVNNSARQMMADLASWLAAPSFPSGLGTFNAVSATFSGGLTAPSLFASGGIVSVTGAIRPYLEAVPTGWAGLGGYIQAGNNDNLSGTGDNLTIAAPAAKAIALNIGTSVILKASASALVVNQALSAPSLTLTTPLALAQGGTGATSAAAARSNLGLGTIATQPSSGVAITGGTITGITDLALADGGTGASDAATARTNLGLGTMATQSASSYALLTGATFAGPVGIGVGPPTGASPLFWVKSTAADYVAQFEANTATGLSYGPRILAGTNASDIAFLVRNAANTIQLMLLNGVGAMTLAGSFSSGGAISRDANFALDLISSNPRITLDTGDYWEFNRSTNKMSYYVGSTAQFSVDSGGNGVFRGNVTAAGTP